jgi:isopenicillin N synthase-like dioxygenase
VKSAVPILDLSDWWSGSSDRRAALAAQMRDAAHRVGFFQVVEHGVSDQIRQSALMQMDRFFELPLDEKSRVVPEDGTYRGYSGRKSESFAYTVGDIRPADLVEAFVMGSDELTSDRGSDLHGHRPNIWPTELSGFHDDVQAYYNAAKELSKTLTDIAAVALELPDDFFTHKVDHAVVTMRMNWYQRHANDPELDEAQMALGAHTDYGILTVLLADPGPGLQILSDDSKWLDVEPIDGAFIVNIGDALAVWTNNFWKSTVHRVVPTMAPGGRARRSIALFQDGNFATTLAPLPAFVSAERPAQYGATTLGQHVTDKISGGRNFAVPDVQQTLGSRTTSDA